MQLTPPLLSLFLLPSFVIGRNKSAQHFPNNVHKQLKIRDDDVHDEFHVDAEAEPLGELHGGTAGAGGGVLGVPTSSLGCQDWRILCCPIHHPHHPLPNRELLLPPLHLMPRSFLQGGRALILLEVDLLDVVAEVGPDANVHPLPAAVMWCQNAIR